MVDRVYVPKLPSTHFREGAAYRITDVGLYMGEKYHRLGYYGEGVHIALVDSGVGLEDRCGHGSAMKQAILSVAPKANVVSYKILDDEGNGDMDRLEEILKSLSGKGFHIVNLSLGRDLDCGGICYSCEAIQQLAMEGVHVFAAIGNNADTTNVPNCPAVSPGAMSVGGETVGGEPTAFTMKGWSANGRMHPMIQAPGGNGVMDIPDEWLMVDVPKGSQMDLEFPQLRPGRSATRGSSVSTALVSGTTALLVDAGVDVREFWGVPPVGSEPSGIAMMLAGVSTTVRSLFNIELEEPDLEASQFNGVFTAIGQYLHEVGEDVGKEIHDHIEEVQA